MGRNSDKLYITSSEWAVEGGGAKAKARGSEFKKLPFTHCALSLQPFTHPVATDQGHIFELLNIMPWIKKHGNNPVTGAELDASQLTRLNFTRSTAAKVSDLTNSLEDPASQFMCPVLFKVFNDHTHIVAIKTTGNVYSYEAIERLCIKTKNWKDLLTDEPFKRKDIITIQDATGSTSIRNINEFHYVKKMDAKGIEGNGAHDKDPSHFINAKGATAKVLSLMKKDEKEEDNGVGDGGGGGGGEEAAAVNDGEMSVAGNDGKTVPSHTSETSSSSSSAPPPPKLTPSFVIGKNSSNASNPAHYSNNTHAMSFTSTSVSLQTRNVAAAFSEEDHMFRSLPPVSMGFVSISTNLGDINLQLYCSDAPRTCFNFIQLAKRGFYNGVSFHRSIKNFMIQGGDPTGTGKGGESCWKAEFQDEFNNKKLSHNERGVLSMANRGKDTNSSQFFITYRPCTHLDGKHTIFGKLVGGMDVLNAMELVAVGKNEKPVKEIKMKAVTVFVDPYEEFQKKLQEKAEKARKAAIKNEEEMEERYRKAHEKKLNEAAGSVSSTGIGKYLNLGAVGGVSQDEDPSKKRELGTLEAMEMTHQQEVKRSKNNSKKNVSSGFGNFDTW